jgi:hypothetical protein
MFLLILSGIHFIFRLKVSVSELLLKSTKYILDLNAPYIVVAY